MPRFRIIVEYDGTPFVGWQVQAAGTSVQGALQDAIEKFSGERVSVRGAGRTDAGVHAFGQVAHFDLSSAWEPFRVREAVNYHLKPHPIAVLDCELAPPSFDARFSASRRHYLYRILNRRAPPVLERDRVWWLTVDLNDAAMAEAAQSLVGHHDFTTFRASQCQARSPMKTIEAFSVVRVREAIEIKVSARSFLHNQVRSMVGTLKLAGEGKWTAGDVAQALGERRRSACGPVAPAPGLYLQRVDYEPVAAALDASDIDDE